MSERLILHNSIALLYGVLGAWILFTQPAPFSLQLYLAGSSLVMIYGFVIAFQTPPQRSRARRLHSKKHSKPPPTPGPKTHSLAIIVRDKSGI